MPLALTHRRMAATHRRGGCAPAAAARPRRRTMLAGGVVAASWWPFGGDGGTAEARAYVPKTTGGPKRVGDTNEVVEVVEGMFRKRMGGGDIVCSELGLGTQRWGSTDFNGPDEALCHRLLTRAVERGVNLVDTAEQYPIPSGPLAPEGRTEEIIGRWYKKGGGRREDLVIASKITGGSNVKRRTIVADCEGSLRRLGTDCLDLYLLHWPARYTPQSNWGQSLAYHVETERSPYYRNAASFEEIATAMGELIDAGKIRGYGMCNDNAYGLTAQCYAARSVGAPPPVVMQNDYSLLDRRSEENGVWEASSPVHENVGFMGYNLLAGGVLTGKYKDVPASPDDVDRARAKRNASNPRGRMDTPSWGRTLYRYRSGPALEATAAYSELAAEAGLSLTELALRWSRQRENMTSALVGQSSIEQLDEALDAFTTSEPLPADVMWGVDRIHMRNRLPIFASDVVGEDWYGSGEIGERIP